MDPPKVKFNIAQGGSMSRVDVPTAPLIVLYGLINGRQCKILKDDGCNTNVISSEFIKRNKYFNLLNQKLNIEHSNEDAAETTSEIVLDGSVQIGKHIYTSNFAVDNCSYYIILGTPWHRDNDFVKDYSNYQVTVNGRSLPVPKSLNK